MDKKNLKIRAQMIINSLQQQKKVITTREEHEHVFNPKH
jgi:hypothetical protein